MGLIFLGLWRELGSHPWQVLLTVFSIAAGVTVVVGVDIANSSAMGEFQRANSLVDGVATHRIVGGERGIDQNIYRMVRVEARIRDAAPVIEATVGVQGDEGRYRLLGIDPLSDFRIRGAALGADFSVDFDDTPVWPVSTGSADHGKVGDSIRLIGNDRAQAFTITNSLSGDSVELDVSNLLVTDIAWAQAFLGMDSKISYIALRLSDQEQVDRLQGLLPPSVRMVDIGLYNSAKQEMTRAFRTNLTALGLLALVIAMFLVYSAVSFQATRRTALFARLRSLGVTSRELGAALILEIVLVALLGTVLGVLLGFVLANTLTGLVTGTINALYFSLSASDPSITAFTLVKAVGVGVATTLIAAAVPIALASTTPVHQHLRRSSQERGARLFSRWAIRVALALLVAGVICLLTPTRHLFVPFTGLFLVILSLAALAPRVILGLSRAASRMQVGERLLFFKMALVNMGAYLSRTAVAVAALTIAVSATLGVGLMIDSFRFSVERWMAGYLRADVYLTSESVDRPALHPDFLQQLSELEGVRDISLGTRRQLTGSEGPITLFALATSREGFAGFQMQASVPSVWDRFHEGRGVLVTEPLSRRLDLDVGNRVALPTDRGTASFEIVGIYRDYSSDQGLVTMSWQTYEAFFNSKRVASAALYLDPDANVDALMARIRSLERKPEALFLRSNRGLREASLDVFDQTFLITEVLRWLALAVAVTGIVSSLMALQLERRREYAVLRAIGFSRLQLMRQMLAETSMTGLVAGLLAIPMGVLLALMLIHVINVRSFGWSMETVVDGGLLASGVTLAVLAGLIGGLYPAWALRKLSISSGLRDE